MDTERLAETAQFLVSTKKGILAADESTGTIARRFAGVNVESTETNRRDYREMLFSTSGVSEFISGAILYDETIRQRTAGGSPMTALLQEAGVYPGIKVDKGTQPIPGSPDELMTEGLDGLRDRLAEYAQLGARFTKWRAVIKIGPGLPSSNAVEINAHSLARFAALSQEAGLVPIVEPEVLLDGDHDIAACFAASESTFHEVFHQLFQQKVLLEGMLLKPSMITSGKDAMTRAQVSEVAEQTISCLMRAVPAAVPGIAFLSGGQGSDEAVENLDAINRRASDLPAPWQLSFSFGRALQEAPLKCWAENREDWHASQHVFYQQAKKVSQARQGGLGDS